MSGRISYYGGIVKEGLMLDLDAAKLDSYNRIGTTWNDISDNKNSGTLLNGPTFNSDNGGSIVFDGVNDKAQLLSKLFQGINNFTFTCVIKNIKSTYTFYGGPIYTEWTTGAGIDNTVGFGIGESASGGAVSSTPFKVSMFYQISNVVWQVYSNATIPVNTTCHLTFMKNDNMAYIYINGVLDSTNVTSSGVLDTRTNNPLIGSVGYGAYFNGNIYTISAYNRALSSGEVLQNYNALKVRFGL